MYNYGIKLTIPGMFPPTGRKNGKMRSAWRGPASKRKCRKPDRLPAGNCHLYSVPYILPDLAKLVPADLIARRVKRFV